MFVNYKFNREEENVVVSSDNGVMDTREYQDNIEDILVLQDVIEGLESKLDAEKDKRTHLIQQYRDSIAKIKEFKKRT